MVLLVSFALKRRIMIGVLAAVAVWPAAHHVLARRYHFNPWKLFGWAMYAAPTPLVEVRFAELIDGRARAIPLSDDLRAAVAAWADRRLLWGEWLAPEDLARALSSGRAGTQRILIQVRLFTLDRETAMVGFADRSYEYRVAGDLVERVR
jgi:hypothetical protein